MGGQPIVLPSIVWGITQIKIVVTAENGVSKKTYILEINAGFKQQSYLKASNSEVADYFGQFLSISGDTLVIGAHGEDSNQTTITNGTTASPKSSVKIA